MSLCFMKLMFLISMGNRIGFMCIFGPYCRFRGSEIYVKYFLNPNIFIVSWV